jgi:hypothetical protein
MSFQDIFSNILSLEIPEYQRTYVWKSTTVEKLVNDLYNAFRSYQKHSRPGQDSPSTTYFMGSIVVMDTDERSNTRQFLQVVDGQQRLTTYVMIMAMLLHKVCDVAGGTEKTGSFFEYVRELLATSANGSRDSGRKYRLKLQEHGDCYSTFDKFIQDPTGPQSLLTHGEALANSTSNDSFKVLLYHNAKAIDKALNEKFGHLSLAHVSLIEFAKYVAERSHFMVLFANDLGGAYKVFYTLNKGGVSLSGIDLLKSKLFYRSTKGLDKRAAERGKQNDVIKKWQNMTKYCSDVDLIRGFDTLYRVRQLKVGTDDAKDCFIQSFGQSFENHDSSIYKYYMDQHDADAVSTLIHDLEKVFDVFQEVDQTKLNVAKFQWIYCQKWPSEVAEMWRVLVVLVGKKLEQLKVSLTGGKQSKGTWKSIDLVAACFIAANKENTMSATSRRKLWQVCRVRAGTCSNPRKGHSRRKTSSGNPLLAKISR